MRYLLAILISAFFNTSTTAIISWEQPPDPPGLTLTCLYRIYPAPYPAGICYEDLSEGVQSVELPGPLTDPAYRPAYGDIYRLDIQGVEVGRAVLGESIVYTTYVALMKAGVGETQRLVYLPHL